MSARSAAAAALSKSSTASSGMLATAPSGNASPRMNYAASAKGSQRSQSRQDPRSSAAIATIPDSSRLDIPITGSAPAVGRRTRNESASSPGAPISHRPDRSATKTKPKQTTDALMEGQSQMMPQTLKELDSLLEAISDKIPANQQAPKNQRHARAFQRKMATYFRQLGAAFPQSKIDGLYRRHVED